jgi:glycosyltransferase involved in cell wall biosynthesis
MSYVVITPARNEAPYIEKTIRSVIAQTIRPKKWIIVNDSSTDSTEEICQKYARGHDFIQLVSVNSGQDRNFSSKVMAFEAGLNVIRSDDFDYLGNLDGDVTLEPDYYVSVIRRFQDSARLGIAGGVIVESIGGKRIRQMNARWSVAGAVQLFRKKCYKEIGGYLALKKGGVDAIAEAMARMRGWEVRCFPELEVVHHGRAGTKRGKIISARFRQGIMDYSHGNHPIFEVSKCISRAAERPRVIGCLVRMSGYLWSGLRQEKRPLPEDLVRFLRTEQLERLRDRCCHPWTKDSMRAGALREE